VDQIVDWARDIYRENILNEMLAVGHLEIRALDISSQHSDILSHRPDVHTSTSSIASLDMYSTTDDDRALKFNISHLLRFLDVEGSVIRDARYVHHNYYGICVTVENVNDIFKISTSERFQRKLARQLLQTFHPDHAWLVDCATLQGLQDLWTGRDNVSLWSDEKFIARFGMISSFVVEPPGPQDGAGPSAGNWQQTHDLCFTAIEESAVELLGRKAYREPRDHNPSQWPKASKKLVHDIFMRHRYASVEEHLSAAITTQMWVTTTSSMVPATECSNYEEADLLHLGQASYLPEAAVNDDVQDDAMNVISLPKKFSKDLRLGTQEITTTYFITSKQYADLTENPEAKEIRKNLAELWPKPSLFIPKSESAIVVRASGGESDCLFLKQGAFSPHRNHVVLQIQHAFQCNVPIWDEKRIFIDARRAKKPRMLPGSLNDAISILAAGLTSMDYVLKQRDKMTGHSPDEDASCYSIHKRMRAYLQEVIQIPPSEKELDQAMVEMTKELNKVAKAYNLRALLKELQEVYDAMYPDDEGSESASESQESSVDLDETLFSSENEQSDSSNI
jgi:hypothetical protein